MAESGGIYVPTFKSLEEEKASWPEGAKHRVMLKNGEVVGGEIVKKTDQALTVRQKLEEGGAISLDLSLERVETIDLWRPELNPGERFQVLKSQNPDFKLIQKNYYHILTSEQDPAELKLYVNELDHFYHDFLMYFFDLIDRDRQPEPLDVVIFGTRNEFDAMLREIGYNFKSNPIGFYHFNQKKLFFYNAKTESGFQKAVGRSRQFQAHMEKLGSEIQAQYGSQSTKVQGAIERASDQAERYELQVNAEARTRTLGVIRHEGAHQLFHLLGIMPSELYQGGWLVEGIAVYGETEPIGEVHETRLIELRYELESRDLMPLEYLLNFGRGTDFHKMDPLYANLAYAESWAFIYFLMHQGYGKQFFDYLKALRLQSAEFNSTLDRALLEQHIGKNVKDLEQDFFAFTKRLVQESVDEKTYQEYRLRLIRAA